jgi:hypothetical protein
MNKWIGYCTAVALTFSSLYADAPATRASPQVQAQEEDATDDTTDAKQKKPVGKAASDGSDAGMSTMGKYLLAAGAIAIAITALILVKRHHGHHHHGHS